MLSPKAQLAQILEKEIIGYLLFLPSALVQMIVNYCLLCQHMTDFTAEHMAEHWLDRNLDIAKPLQLLFIGVEPLVSLLTIRSTKTFTCTARPEIEIESNILFHSVYPHALVHDMELVIFGSKELQHVDRLSSLFISMESFGYFFHLDDEENVFLRDTYKSLSFSQIFLY